MASFEDIVSRGKSAACELNLLSTPQKNQFLRVLASLLCSNKESLIAANRRDLLEAQKHQLSSALLDRLTLTDERIDAMAMGVEQVMSLPDPTGVALDEYRRDDGLLIKKISVPIGLIGIFYESRPNVTIDCAILCLKSGNACLLKGGKEARHSNEALVDLLTKALIEAGINEHAIQLISTSDRSDLKQLLQYNNWIDCIIPRGGEGLIRFISENTSIPVIKHYKGVCNLYVDKEADVSMARSILINAKCQRPGVCNAVENLFIHRDFGKKNTADILQALHNEGVELRVDASLEAILLEANIPFKAAQESDFHEEYLALVLAARYVSGPEEAVELIHKYGSGHSEAIVSSNEATAQFFLQAVDASAVYWNASTRFTDGYEFGLGAEIGISTDRIHARGPMGLRELCTYKYQIQGQGHIR